MYNCLKRLFDIVVSFFSIIIFSPIGLVAVIGIIISDPGPIFYFANRVGKNNKVFKMIKFRTMRVDKNANEKSLRPNQDRIFRWGKIMRDTK